MNVKAGAEVERLFEKTFQYQQLPCANKESAWQLPNCDTLYKEVYCFDELQLLKQRLNGVKSKLNNHKAEEWSAHTKRMNPAGQITWKLKHETKAEFVTIAWAKFYECLHRYALVTGPRLNSLHLCEAPGAFITALNHFLYTTYEREQVHWQWLATTLNPYYEGNPVSRMIIDERFILYTLDNWLFHEDFTGNIIDTANIAHMVGKCTEKFPDGVQLITADGSIDCAEMPDFQEDHVATLHLAEIVSALTILSAGGCFVIKMFTLFEAGSVCLMYLLNCAFAQVHMYKPATSKQGNSEAYVICLDYKKDMPHLRQTVEAMKVRLSLAKPNDLPMFAKSQLPGDFLMQHEICCRRLMNLQIQAIESNIVAYQTKSRARQQQAHKLRGAVCSAYYARYKVRSLPSELCILQQSHKIAESMPTSIHKGSYTEREQAKNLSMSERVFRLRGELNNLVKKQSWLYDSLAFELDTKLQPLPLQVYIGVPVRRLHSSLFVSLAIMLLRIDLQEVFQKDTIWALSPQCLLDDDDADNADDVVVIKYTHTDCDAFYVIQEKFFMQVLDGILEKNAKSLTFSALPFLTHYSVSILRYLAGSVYSKMVFTMSPHYTIKLSVPQTDASDKLIELRTQLSTVTGLHCVQPITELHRNRFVSALIEYNDCVLLEGFKRILHE